VRIIFLRNVHEFVTDVFFIRRKNRKKIKTNKGKMKKMKGNEKAILRIALSKSVDATPGRGQEGYCPKYKHFV
jgi:hypothetical protein